MTQAAITTKALYEFDTGDDSNVSLLTDTSGNGLNWTGAVGTYTKKTDAPVSGAGYLSVAQTNTIIYGANMAGLYTDNFAIGMWVRVDNTTTVGTLFCFDGYVDNLNLIQNGSQWTAAYDKNPLNGVTNSIGTSADIALNSWTHLSVIRQSGASTFYVNGIAQGGSNTTTPTISSGTQTHFGGGTGNASDNRTFYGDFDRMQVLSFDASDSTQDILQAMAVPEPSSAALLGLGGVALIMRRRK